MIFGGFPMEVASKGSAHAKRMGIVCLAEVATLHPPQR